MDRYAFANDGEDEPTLWRLPPQGIRANANPVAVMRRCDNPEAFDLLMTLSLRVSLTFPDEPGIPQRGL